MSDQHLHSCDIVGKRDYQKAIIINVINFQHNGHVFAFASPDIWFMYINIIIIAITVYDMNTLYNTQHQSVCLSVCLSVCMCSYTQQRVHAACTTSLKYFTSDMLPALYLKMHTQIYVLSSNFRSVRSNIEGASKILLATVVSVCAS